MNWKHFLFHSWKIRAEGRIPLNIHTETPQGRKAMFPVISAWMTFNARILWTGFVRVISATRKSWYSNFHPSKQVFMVTINLFTIPIQVTIELLTFLCIWCIFKNHIKWTVLLCLLIILSIINWSTCILNFFNAKVIDVCLFRVFRPTRECFTHMEMSPWSVKGCKFLSLLGTYDQ